MSRRTGTGRHPQGRIHLDVGRHAGAVGRPRTPLRRLGDVPSEGLARRPEPPVRVAGHELVRAADPALGRRRPDLGAGRATSSPTTVRPAPTSGTTARRTRGSSRASGTSSPRGPIPTRCTPASRTPHSSARPTAAQSWHELPGLRRHESASAWQPGAGGMCLHTILLDPTDPRRIYGRHLRGRGLPQRRRRHDVATDQPRPGLRADSRSDGRGRPLRPPHRDAPLASRTSCSCRSTGTSCAATTAVRPGRR